MAITSTTAFGVPIVQQGGSADPAPAAEPAPEVSVQDEQKPTSEQKTVEIDDIKPEELKAFAGLSQKLREEKAAKAVLEAKVKELEAAAAGPAEQKTAAEKLVAIQAATKDGKHLAAARVAGIDLEAAVQEYLAEDKPGEVKDPRLDALLEERAAEKKKAEDEKAAKEKADQAEAVAAAESAKAAATEYVKAQVEAAKEKWPHLGTPEAHGMVVRVAEGAAKALGRAVTDEEAAKIIEDAMGEVELDLRVRERIEAERKAAEQPQGREVKPRRGLETREIDSGGSRQPSPTIDAQRSNTRSAPPETRRMSAREAREVMNKELRARQRN